MTSFFDQPLYVGLPIFVVAVVAVSALIVIALRRWVRRASGGHPEWDRVLSYVVGAYGVFYGVTLGLIAAGAYGNFTVVNNVVLQESSAVAVLYRDAAFLPEPTSSELKTALVAYTKAVIAEDWPLQERQIAPEQTDGLVAEIQQVIVGFEPAEGPEMGVRNLVIGSFNDLITERRERISLTHLSLPPMLWVVISVGAFLNAVLLALIEVKNIRIHLLMCALIATYVALMLYSIAGFDHVYSGPISVSPQYFQNLVDGLFVEAP